MRGNDVREDASRVVTRGEGEEDGGDAGWLGRCLLRGYQEVVMRGHQGLCEGTVKVAETFGSERVVGKGYEGRRGEREPL